MMFSCKVEEQATIILSSLPKIVQQQVTIILPPRKYEVVADLLRNILHFAVPEDTRLIAGP